MTRRHRRIVQSLLVITAAFAVAGCYERVIREEGLGARTGPRYEPNLKQGDDRSPLDAVGDVIFGPVEPERR